MSEKVRARTWATPPVPRSSFKASWPGRSGSKIDNESFVKALSMEHTEIPGPDGASRICKSALYRAFLAERGEIRQLELSPAFAPSDVAESHCQAYEKSF